jgi:UDP-N-acetylglucosamine transferase subunit ALG13
VIFVVAGTERFAFDRLFRGVEDALRAGGGSVAAFAQLGHSLFRPTLFPWAAFLSFDEMVRRVRQARVVVSHAGAGSTLLCRDLGKIPILMPRRAALGEHVDDHQLEFACEVQRAGIALVVHTQAELGEALAQYEQKTRGMGGADFVSSKQRLIDHLQRLYGAPLQDDRHGS